MARRRLLGTVAAVTVTVAAAAGPASAQTIGLPGVGDLVTVGDGCIDVDDLTLGQLASLGADACVSDDGVAIDVDAYLVGREVPTDPVTGAVSGAPGTVTETAKRTTGGSGGSGSDGGGSTPEPAPSDAPSSGGGAPAPSAGAAGGEGGARSPAVAPAGGVVERPTAADRRERARQLGAVRALRSDLARGTALDSGVAGPVVPFGGLSSTDDLASPEVADGAVVPGVDDRLAPGVDPEGGEALFASSSPSTDRGQVPLALQLLAAALVLGTGAVWTIARRELGGALPQEL